MDQRIDVAVEWIDRADLQDVVEEHVALQGAHEEKRARTRIGDTHRPRLVGAGEVSGDQEKRSTRWRVLSRRIEGQLERSSHRVLAHGHDDA